MPAARPDLTAARWRRSSYSSPSGDNCVEVADDIRSCISVRDSKDPQGPALIFTPEAWTAFVGSVKSGSYA